MSAFHGYIPKRTYTAEQVKPLVEALRKAEQLYVTGLINAPDGLYEDVHRLRREALKQFGEG